MIMSDLPEIRDVYEKTAESGSLVLYNEAQSLLDSRIKIPGERVKLLQSRNSTPECGDLGPTNPEKELTVTVMVKSKASEKEMDDALAKITSGKMAPLSDLEFTARFGVDEEALKRVLKFASRHELKAVEVDPRSGRVELSGKAKDFNEAFKVDLKDYQDKDSGPFHSHAEAASVPRGISKDIDGIFGLDNRKIAEPHIVLSPPDEVGFQPLSLFSVYIPTRVADVYNSQKESMGKGQSVAITLLGVLDGSKFLEALRKAGK
jgi:kumamolisin